MKTIQHKFVEFIPNSLEQDVLYISVKYRTAVHLCVCGCGNKVVTPLSPTDWELRFDGKTVSLYPSIGNWNFECKAHYFITRNKIIHARRWDESKIDEGRMEYAENKKIFFKKLKQKKKKIENLGKLPGVLCKTSGCLLNYSGFGLAQIVGYR